jgi:hypothetical protein
MSRRERARLLLRGLAKLVAVVVVAGAIGAALGIGLSKLSGDDTAPAPAAPTTAASTSVPAATTASPPSEPAATAASLAKVRVRVLGAVLHVASTPSGVRRRRARLAIRVRAENTGATSVTLARPTLTAAGISTKADPKADAPTTNFGPLAAGETRTVTLRFETAGAQTAALASERRGQLRIAGRTLPPLFVTVGAPLRNSAGER